jgi:hypothetical protein
MAAEKSIPTPEADVAIKAAESTAKVFEDAIARAQSQYLTVLGEAQNIALEAYRTMIDGVSRMGLPGLPGLPGFGDLADVVKVPANMVDSAFAFGEAVLESQRSFAKKLFEATV